MYEHNREAWPENYLGAVSLTFDDGDRTQLERAAPMMEERDFRGAFYLCPKGDDYAEALKPWVDMGAKGHEIGNHSLSHTCSRNFSDDPNAKGLEGMTLEEMEADLVEAERRLQEVIPARLRSFAYPCYQTYVGEGETRQSYVPIVARHFIAGRSVGEYAFFNSPINCDLACLWCTPAEHMRSPEMNGLVERALTMGQWLIFTFHHIGGARLGTTEYDFEWLLDYLAQNRERIWVAPVVEIAEYIIQMRRERGIRT